MATIRTTGRAGTASAGGVATRRRRVAIAAVVVALLAASASAVVIAALLMPDSYSWVRHSVSESAGQGVQDAWVARLGFLLLGFAVLLLAGIAGPRWGPLATPLFRLYGVAMIATAAFAHKPWLDVPFDAFEDVLHSVTANAVGFTFTVGVLLVAFRRGPGATAAQVFDGFAIVCAVVISMMVVNVSGLGVAGAAHHVRRRLPVVWPRGAPRRARPDPADGRRAPDPRGHRDRVGRGRVTP